MHTSRHSTCAISNPHLSFAAGFGTLALYQVAGFHRAGPSTALDKAVCSLHIHFTQILAFVKSFCKFYLQLCNRLFLELVLQLVYHKGVEFYEGFAQKIRHLLL